MIFISAIALSLFVIILFMWKDNIDLHKRWQKEFDNHSAMIQQYKFVCKTYHRLSEDFNNLIADNDDLIAENKQLSSALIDKKLEMSLALLEMSREFGRDIIEDNATMNDESIPVLENNK